MAYLVLHYKQRGIRGNSNVLEWLLRRKPTGLLDSFTQAIVMSAIEPFTTKIMMGELEDVGFVVAVW
ncbi:uncharacterized protein FPOAC1_013978 [Fusarium poae]|uniref:uncharacterized protein n=1 Tax=Fusarium poae TaxID=36050 RepID=UPI001D040220|nr:uncharacterized protein FPOAC1_013978 [Fusarium poae]KAG8664271.1 hypothetical protein FPOAC1_013978 [Fusarium poae]